MNSRPSNDLLENARRFLDEANEKLERLRTLEPLLLDVSLRENSVGSPIGPTLAEKLEMLPHLREFGFENILLGTLNYANPDVLEVDDDFMMYLRDHEVDRTGCFASTSIGLLNLEGEFIPDPSLLKLKAYDVPNTILEVYLSQERMTPLHHSETVCRSLSASIHWLHENIRHGRAGAKPRILVNIIDGCDAFADNLEVVCLGGWQNALSRHSRRHRSRRDQQPSRRSDWSIRGRFSDAGLGRDDSTDAMRPTRRGSTCLRRADQPLGSIRPSGWLKTLLRRSNDVSRRSPA